MDRQVFSFFLVKYLGVELLGYKEVDYIFFNFIEVYLIYKALLISGVQQS